MNDTTVNDIAVNDTIRVALSAILPRAAGRRVSRRGHHPRLTAARGLRAAAVMLAMASLVTAQAGGPREPPAAAAPPVEAGRQALSGIHYQALVGAGVVPVTAPTGEDDLAIFLPRPPFEAWHTASVTSDSSCLLLGSLRDPGAGFVLVQEARALGEDGASLGPGESCSALVRAAFSDDEDSWEAAVAVHVHRPAAAPFPYGAAGADAPDDVTAQLTVTRIEAERLDPRAPAQRVLLVEVTLTNNGADDLELVGLADTTGFAAASGLVFRLPTDTYIGTARELRALGGATSNVPVATGESVRLGLLLDPEATLARTAGTLTVQPALIVRRGDDTYSLRLSRVSTTWGEELP